MTTPAPSRLPDLLAGHDAALLEDWIREQLAAPTARLNLIPEADLRRQTADLLALILAAWRSGKDPAGAAWEPVLAYLAGISRDHAKLGFTPSQTATMVFSLKQPLFSLLRQALAGDAQALGDELWNATTLLDGLGLYTTEVFQQARAELLTASLAEQHDQTRRLIQSEQHLLARNANLTDFAYTVAHDLRAPLRGIAGYAEELARQHAGNLDQRGRFCLEQIRTATARQDHLILDLLRIARLEAETPALTAVDLNALIATLLGERSLIISDQHVVVTVDLPPALTLWSWAAGLSQVLGNLIDNALTFSRLATPPHLGIRAEETDRCWRITVSDNGIGFDMAHHDRIFGLFQRLVHTEDYPGTGVGLAIVKRVVEKLDGSVRAESSPGQGARFQVELPRPPARTVP